MKCPYDCYTCDGNNNCLSCSSSDMRQLSNSRCVALQGYYSDGINSMCIQCPRSCSSCTSSNLCAACNPGYFLDLTNLCVADCGIRLFINILALTCQSCPYDCYTCDSSGFCLTCNATTDYRILSSTTKRCVPLSGFYEINVTVSAPCPTCCATCASASQCNSCLSGCFLNVNLSCLTSCSERFFQNTQTWKCSACPYDCLTCDSSKSCLSCSPSDFRTLSSNRCVPNDGYYDNLAQAAVRCPTTCKTCISFTVCKTCVNGYYLRNDSKCHSSCLVPTYADNSTLTCKSCPSSCAICRNATYCTICANSNYVRIDNMCYSSCLERYYADIDQLTCKNCPYDCYTCNSDGSCTSCNALSDYRQLSTNGRRCVALNGYFDNNATICV